MSTILDSIILGCWIIFAAWWFVSALRVKAPAERQSRRSALAHQIPVGLGWFLLGYQRLPPPMNLVLMPRMDWVRIIGIVVCVFGLYVTIWARRTLAGNWSSDVTFKQRHELVKTGPYRFVRHPIYTGLLVMCLGSAIEIGSLHCLLSPVVVGIGFWIKLK